MDSTTTYTLMTANCIFKVHLFLSVLKSNTNYLMSVKCQMFYCFKLKLITLLVYPESSFDFPIFLTPSFSLHFLSTGLWNYP